MNSHQIILLRFCRFNRLFQIGRILAGENIAYIRFADPRAIAGDV